MPNNKPTKEEGIRLATEAVNNWNKGIAYQNGRANIKAKMKVYIEAGGNYDVVVSELKKYDFSKDDVSKMLLQYGIYRKAKDGENTKRAKRGASIKVLSKTSLDYTLKQAGGNIDDTIAALRSALEAARELKKSNNGGSK